MPRKGTTGGVSYTVSIVQGPLFANLQRVDVIINHGLRRCEISGSLSPDEIARVAFAAAGRAGLNRRSGRRSRL